MNLYMYTAIAVFFTRFHDSRVSDSHVRDSHERDSHVRDSHVVKSRGVLVYFLVFPFLLLPFFLTFHGSNMKWRFINKFLSNQAYAMDSMDFDPTEPGRSSLDRVRPGFPLSKESDISDVWGGMSPLNDSNLISAVGRGMSLLNDSDLSFFESNKVGGGGLEAGPSKSKRAPLPGSSYKPLLPSRCYKQKLLPNFKPKAFQVPNKSYKPKAMLLPSRSDKPISEIKKTSDVTFLFEEILKERKEEKYLQSEIHTVIKPKLVAELSKTHNSNTKPDIPILRLYSLPTGLPNKRWEEAAEAILGKEDANLWKEKVKELRHKEKNSDFYRSVAEWLLSKYRSVL